MCRVFLLWYSWEEAALLEWAFLPAFETCRKLIVCPSVAAVNLFNDNY